MVKMLAYGTVLYDPSYNITDSNYRHRISGAEVTLNGETKITDKEGYCEFEVEKANYTVYVYAEDYGAQKYLMLPDEKHDYCHFNTRFLERVPYFTLSADKTKIKKNETVTIVAKASEHLKKCRQVVFEINETQTVIADYDLDRDIAVMELTGSNQGKVQITAHGLYEFHPQYTAYSNVLFIQDGQEE